MNNLKTEAIFLVTGLIAAAGANKEHATLKLAHSLVEEDQYIAAIYTAEKIIEHYPESFYAESARKLIEVIRHDYLDQTYHFN
ncbi:tetratricopeptide repeat protein [Fodinibius halophilus]|uniref:Outer membrane protein assembly factor BamD n=1 Tax=Fodinibius halophilus TaxID=1736908 RepID=A0A6M1T3G9_9BACT|nr:hypothetical protein [Fodinibius halophilus]NGP87173.1 hypothetical protein [Fodinibius halophilus]